MVAGIYHLHAIHSIIPCLTAELVSHIVIAAVTVIHTRLPACAVPCAVQWRAG